MVEQEHEVDEVKKEELRLPSKFKIARNHYMIIRIDMLDIYPAIGMMEAAKNAIWNYFGALQAHIQQKKLGKAPDEIKNKLSKLKKY